MNERRAASRKRVIYGAMTVQQNGQSYDCMVKNWSDLGARVEFSEPTNLTEDVALIVAQTGLSYRARVVWSKDNAAGLAFISAPADTYAPKGELDNRLRETERARLLQRRVSELQGEG